MMMIKPNYKKAEILARKILKDSKVKGFPLDLDFFRKVYNKTHNTRLRIKSFSWYMKKYNLSYSGMIEFINSEDGCCFYSKEEEKAIIIYNDFLNNAGRIRWTIAHEFGHLILGHINNDRAIITRNKLSEKEYSAYELEANTFARELLAPMSLVYYIYNCLGDKLSIDSIFGISHEAAQNILNRMLEWSKTHDYSKDTCLYVQFSKFIHSKYCSSCNHFFLSSNKQEKYCKFCGNEFEFKYKEDVNTMKYKDYDISKNKQVLRCLTCDNEDIDFNNDKYAFCHICGSPVINKCLNKNEKTQCGKSLPANARFCPYCGSETLFYEKGLLKAWNKKQEETPTFSFDSEVPPEDEIPF